MLTRKNTVNGRIYGEDDTFLAFETGNEMNWGQIHFNDSNINIHPSQLNLNQSSNHPITSNSSQHPSPRNSTSFTLTHTRPAPADVSILPFKLRSKMVNWFRNLLNSSGRLRLQSWWNPWHPTFSSWMVVSQSSSNISITTLSLIQNLIFTLMILYLALVTRTLIKLGH